MKILASLAALTLIPSTAMAQSPAAQRHGQPVQTQRHDGRDAKHDYRNDARDYGRSHPWRATFKYQRFQVGARIQPAYYGRNYVITDYARFRWARPGLNQQWVRHYDDALLVNVRTGRVIKVIYNAFR